MRSARRNIGEHSANRSSLPAAGRPDDRWRMETAVLSSLEWPSSNCTAHRFLVRRYIGVAFVRRSVYVRAARYWPTGLPVISAIAASGHRDWPAFGFAAASRV